MVCILVTCYGIVVLMIQQPPRSTRPDTHVPYTTLVRYTQNVQAEAGSERIEPMLPAPTDNVASIHTCRRGAAPGTFLHGLLEWAADESFPVAASSPPELAELIAHRCQRHGWQAWSQALTDWLPAFLATPLRIGRAHV